MSTARTEPIGRGARRARAPAGPLALVALAGLGAALCVWLAAARATHGPAPPRPAAERPGVELAPVTTAARTPASTGAPAPAGSAGTAAASARDARRARPPRSEAEHLAAFLARARATPGSLEATAAAILDGSGSRAEKLALLAALRALDSPERLAWHEHAARSKTEAEPTPGLSLADAALQQLLAEAARSLEARAALARLAFDEPAPAAAARRRAAAGLARHAGENELGALAAALARERDELLVAGVLGALAEREPSAGRTRILLAHGRSDGAPVSGTE
ncbi:MAG TPA: hypothetical protein VF530_02640 [Planctomycetota bacterium]